MDATMRPVAIPRPQVGIERLPARRVSSEPRESMNCKSCRKRKIKCNRLRPSCEACQVFQCPCVYDAVPKKRGPKTDVLEALLKRVDGLEARLKHEKKSEGDFNEETTSSASPNEPGSASASPTTAAPPSALEPPPKRPRAPSVEIPTPQVHHQSIVPSPTSRCDVPSEIHPEVLLNAYFTHFHGKPFHIIDEALTRQRYQANQLPQPLAYAVFAVAARYAPHPNGSQAAAKLGEGYATRARSDIDVDEPSIDSLQALLLLVTAFTASGKGKRAYMLMSTAVGMAVALELHREVDAAVRITAMERESRRRLFWTCYLLDRFMACGSKRPCLISDKTVLLRLPSWTPANSPVPIEGDFFQHGSNLHFLQGNGKKSQGSSGMLIDVTRILGVTNQYLAAGGIKGDSHFPWHSLSHLSKIRQDLDIWASGTEHVFSSVDSLFGQHDSTVLVLSKLIYHLIHCLVYRPFLPIDLAELSGSGQHQSWQIEATQMCFLHANAMAELVELGKQNTSIQWPAFVGYCICTAGTVHTHGAYYNRSGMDVGSGVFTSSPEFLSREMQQLNELRYAWSSVQHHKETLQAVYSAHTELVKGIASDLIRQSPVFHLEDFFDRYANVQGPNGHPYIFDPAYLSLSNVVVDTPTDGHAGHELYAASGSMSSEQGHNNERPTLKRKTTHNVLLESNSTSAATSSQGAVAAAVPTPGFAQRPYSVDDGQSSQAIMYSPVSLHSQQGQMNGQQFPVRSGAFTPVGNTNGTAATQAHGAGFPAPVQQQQQHQQQQQQQQHQARHQVHVLPVYSMSPNFNFATPAMDQMNSFEMRGNDPMFGTVPTNTYPSPAAWNGDADHGRQVSAYNTNNNLATSPGAASHHGSAGTAPAEEKDPFLSLLEQLAETEQGRGTEFDLFLAGAHN